MKPLLISCRLFLLALCCACACGGATGGEPARENPKDEAVDPDVLRKARKLIQGTLSSENAEREAAWKTLRDMGNLAVPGLLALSRQKDTPREMLCSIIKALGDSKDARAGPALAEMLGNAEPLVRSDAARALGDSGYKDGAGPLEKLAGDPKEDEDVRLHAAASGAKLGSEACLNVLAALAESPQPETRSRAVYFLGKYGGVAQISLLEKCLADSAPSVREDAVEALRLQGQREAWGPLVKATEDKEYKVRNAAMDALRSLTRQKIENDPAAWQEWWKKEKDKPAAPVEEKKEPLDPDEGQ